LIFLVYQLTNACCILTRDPRNLLAEGVVGGLYSRLRARSPACQTAMPIREMPALLSMCI